MLQGYPVSSTRCGRAISVTAVYRRPHKNRTEGTGMDRICEGMAATGPVAAAPRLLPAGSGAQARETEPRTMYT